MCLFRLDTAVEAGGLEGRDRDSWTGALGMRSDPALSLARARCHDWVGSGHLQILGGSPGPYFSTLAPSAGLLHQGGRGFDFIYRSSQNSNNEIYPEFHVLRLSLGLGPRGGPGFPLVCHFVFLSQPAIARLVSRCPCCILNVPGA